MDVTVFVTVLSGVITFVVGQLVVKLVIDPVQDLKKSIGQISHTLVERANVIANPGVLAKETMDETSDLLRKLSSQLHAHLYLIPSYKMACRVFYLPPKERIIAASTNLIGLSNSVHRVDENAYEKNAKRVEVIRDSLGIYIAKDSRWPKDIK